MIRLGLLLAALASASVQAQEAGDGVLGSCLAKGNSAEICACASMVLRARVGDEPYARFGEIENRLAALTMGAVAGEGEEAALLGEGYQYFIPHGQAISVCAKKIASGE